MEKLWEKIFKKNIEEKIEILENKKNSSRGSERERSISLIPFASCANGNLKEKGGRT